MSWYNYVASFFAGAFLANFVPHFVHGISGDRFPTPFAHPPGKGLSPPAVNVAWAFVNLLAGCVLFRIGQVASDSYFMRGVFLAGAFALSIMLSIRFAEKLRE